MSRTYRRKHAEIEQGRSPRNFSKQHGWYFKIETYCYLTNCLGIHYYFDIREQTPRERFEQWYIFHGDRKNFFSAPPKQYRKHQRRTEKMRYKKQFNRFLHNSEYEIINQYRKATDNRGYY